MSFYTEWLENGLETFNIGLRQVVSPTAHLDRDTVKRATMELAVLRDTLTCMQKSKIIKMPDHQLQEFLDVKINQEQDFKLIQSPFPSIYMDINPPLVYPGYWDDIEKRRIDECRVHGVMLTETTGKIDNVFITATGDVEPYKDLTPLIKAWRLVLFIPLFDAEENTFCATFGINANGRLVRPASEDLQQATDVMHMRFVTMAVHIMNYLTSPSLILEHKTHDAALQRSRIKRNKPPLPDWYEIRYAKTRHVGAGATGTGAHHAFRYDVRGHFKHIKKGLLAGRVVWCPAHQRGLANETYKPKIYVVQNGQK